MHGALNRAGVDKIPDVDLCPALLTAGFGLY